LTFRHFKRKYGHATSSEQSLGKSTIRVREHPLSQVSNRAGGANVLDLPRVTDFLAGRVGGLDAPLSASLISGGRSNPTYLVTSGERRWVLRRPPYGHVLPSAHDVGREYVVLRALLDSAVPVPRALFLCQDPDVIGAPFYVMDFVDGVLLDTVQTARSVDPADRRRASFAMARAIANLHQIEAESVGLGDFGRPQGYLERQLARWAKQWRASRTTDRPEVDTLLTKLGRDVPENIFPGIVHGDVKLDNILVEPGDYSQIAAVLDWEMATVGDTLCDVGIMLGFWDNGAATDNPLTIGMTHLDGFPTRHELLGCYAHHRGIEPPPLDWYLVFADVKLAVIMEGIHARHSAGATVGRGFDGVADMVTPLLQRALITAADSSMPELRR
jgi:aminoglycoside phosphotransferase (APT) family kinase protein